MNAPQNVKQPEPIGERAPTWADHLAQRRRKHPFVPQNPILGATWAPGAIAVLWAILDKAVAEGNAALAQNGLSERIAVQQTPHERRLSMAGFDGRERQITVFANLRVLEGRVSGERPLPRASRGRPSNWYRRCWGIGCAGWSSVPAPNSRPRWRTTCCSACSAMIRRRRAGYCHTSLWANASRSNEGM